MKQGALISTLFDLFVERDWHLSAFHKCIPFFLLRLIRAASQPWLLEGITSCFGVWFSSGWAGQFQEKWFCWRSCGEGCCKISALHRTGGCLLGWFMFFRWYRCPPVTDNTAVQPFCSWFIASFFLQVRETIEWLSTSFCKLRLASVDFRTFGLFSKWTPYVAAVNTFLEYLIKRLIDNEVANLAQEPVGSSRILAGNVS